MFYYIDYGAVPFCKFYCIENKLETLPNGWEEVDKEKYYKVLLDVYRGAKKREKDK